MSHPLAHVVLGSHYVVGADLVKDAGVSVTYRLCPYVRYAEAQHDRGSQNARLDVGADCDHRAIELVNRQLAQSLLVSGVGADHLGEPAGQGVDKPDLAIAPPNRSWVVPRAPGTAVAGRAGQERTLT